MDTDVSSWMDTLINKLEREARCRRDRPRGNWDGYSDEAISLSGTQEAAWASIRRRERMAETCYDV